MNLIKKFIIFLACVLLLLVTGCNSDIFVSEPPMADEVLKATIDGDGGEVQFHIPEEGLETISLNQVSSLDIFCTYFNAAGDTVKSYSQASEVSRIEFESDFYKFDIEKKDGDIIVKSICNASGYEAVRTIMLQYSYGYRFIDVTMLPGKELMLDSTFYFVSLDVTERTKTNRYRFFNGGYAAQTIEFMPYLNEQAALYVDPNRSDLWVCSNYYSIDVPIYENGDWIIKNMPDVRPGYSYYYDGPDQNTKVPVDIPGKATTTVAVDVVYSQAVGKGCMVFDNEVLDRKIYVTFDVVSVYPIKHEIRIEDVQ